MPTIHVSDRLRDKLKELKVHPRETYEDVIWRLIEGVERSDRCSGKDQRED